MKNAVFGNESFDVRNRAFLLFYLIGQFLIFVSVTTYSQAERSGVTWIITDLLEAGEGVSVVGNPKIIDSPFGRAVHFNGEEDGIFLEEMPLRNLSEFTVEMLIRFDAGGNHEQRYFHTGSVREDRLLLEMRSNTDTWYLDGMVETSGNWVVLMSPEDVHQFGHWYHIAFTVKKGEQITYVNGIKELEGKVEFTPISEGRTSIGVRQNRVSWFRGAIYSIKITNRILYPNEFILSEQPYFATD